MNKKELASFIKYYLVFIAISIIPVFIATILLTGKVSELVLWIITAVIILLFMFIGIIYRPKYLSKKEEKDKQKIDPFK